MGTRYFITFGFGQPLAGCYTIVPGEHETFGAARDVIANTYGGNFAFQYPISDLPRQISDFDIREVPWGTPNRSTPTIMPIIRPRCQGCKLTPAQLTEYVEASQDAGMEPDEYVRREEGTYNSDNGHFLCTSCYIEAGEPSSPKGWVCP